MKRMFLPSDFMNRMFDLQNLPKWHINLPANLTNLAKTISDLAAWKFLEESGNPEMAFDGCDPKVFR
jgi:hypothetical protein